MFKSTSQELAEAIARWKRRSRSGRGAGVMLWFVFSGVGDDYRRMREELLGEEISLKDQMECVVVLRRALPLGVKMPDYLFREKPPDLIHKESTNFYEVQLADLFAAASVCS